MLETLDTIAWASLAVIAGRTAEGIPGALRELCSPNPDTRHKAYWRIDNYVVVQSDLFEAAWYVVPFLLEIVESSISNGRCEVYDLLYEIGNGSAPSDSVITLGNATTQPLAIACRHAVRAGLPLYIRELQTSRDEVREKALALIMSLNDHEHTVLPSLMELITHEIDPNFRQKLLRTMADLHSQPDL